MSFFDKVPLAPPDPIFGVIAAFQKDPRKEKINLGAGIYKTEDLRTPILASVKAAEKAVLESEESKDYLPIEGDRNYFEGMGGLVLGKEIWAKEKERIAAFQTVGATGALKIGGTFLKEEAENPVLIPDPTWPNHRAVLTHSGLKVENYPYYDAKKHKINENLIPFLEKLNPGTILVLHGSCHNPTGCDPTLEQWKELCAVIKAKRLIPFFDFAYQGLGRGLDEDAEAIRYFVKNGIEMLLAVSNAKNLALYGERAGCLFIVSESAKIAEHIISRVKQMIRTNYSNPPIHGARVAAYLLGNDALRKKWEGELKEMRERIHRLRLDLYERLAAKKKNSDFSHFKRGQGMFCYTGMTKEEVERITEQYAIYLPKDGRINICGLTQKNLDYVVDAIATVMG